MTGIVTWSEPRVERLRRLIAERQSSGSIARTLSKEFGQGVSRCAIIGKAHRLKLQLNGKTTKPKDGAKPVRKPRQRKPRIVLPPPPPPPPEPVEPSSLRCSLLELTSTSCRWPIGDPQRKDFCFCGAPAPERPYCAEHTKRAFSVNPRSTEVSYGWR